MGKQFLSLTLKPKGKITQRINGLLGLWVGISFSGLLIWNGIVGTPDQMQGCNSAYPGNEATISLMAGDTLCIPPGEVFIGAIERLPKGACIKIHPSSVFQPIRMSSLQGSIENFGLMVFEESLQANGLHIDNKGKLEFRSAPEAKAQFRLLNRLNAKVEILSNVKTLESKAEIWNYGNIYGEGDLYLGHQVKVENNGKVIFQGTTTFDARIVNFGILHSYENLQMSKKAYVENNCSLIAPNVSSISHKKFYNNGSLLANAGKELEPKLNNPSCATRFKKLNPVVLRFFSPKLIKNYPVLKWQVDKSSQAAYFVLERSTDGQAYQFVQRIDASQKKDETYVFIDKDIRDLYGKTIHYRLQLTNLQGNTNEGPSIHVDLAPEGALSLK